MKRLQGPTPMAASFRNHPFVSIIMLIITPGTEEKTSLASKWLPLTFHRVDVICLMFFFFLFKQLEIS